MKKETLIIKIIIVSLLLIILALLIALNLQINNDLAEKEKNNKNILSEIEESEWIPVGDVDISEVKDDIIGYLSIPVFGNSNYITMPIKETVELKILATAIGHFEDTPLLDGNVCLVAHNSGTNSEGKYVGYFDKIKDLKIGDEIIYNYQSKDYVYKVITNNIISESDLSVLENKDKNTLTLITCVKGAKNRIYRYCVVAER